MIYEYRWLAVGLALSVTGFACFRTPMADQEAGTNNPVGGSTTVTSGGATGTTGGAGGEIMTVTSRGTGGTTGGTSGTRSTVTDGGNSGSTGRDAGGPTNTRRIATAITAGETHSCALLKEGTIQCWGNNSLGFLGIGTTDKTSTVSITVSGITSATGVAAADYHTCAILADGSLHCWGDNKFGELGNGVSSGGSAIPVAVTGVTNARAVTGGLNHTCVLLANGSIQCWGEGEYGQLGNGTSANESVLAPTAVPGIANATTIAAGTFHTCAVLGSGEIRCWGLNGWGALGNGTTTTSTVPVTVSGISNATSVSAGYSHSCALLRDGTVRCWGFGAYLGSGTTANSSVPVPVSGLTDATYLAAGDFHACAVLSNGTVKCWGSNIEGTLGTGTTSTSSALVPVTVRGITSAATVAAGCFHTCALLVDGVVQCWGWNIDGQLGSGSTADSYIPTTVTGF